MFEAQDGRCAICQTQGSYERGSRLHVDHDHQCCPGTESCGSCIRALLCDVCNRGLGYLHDDPVVLRAAAVYIEKHAPPTNQMEVVTMGNKDKKDKDDVTPKQRLADERAIRELRESEEAREAIRKDAKERDEKGKK